jgi:hypothetical protein
MYYLTDQMDVIRQDNTLIPKGHRLWEEYEQWRSEGNTPQPAFTLDELKARKVEALKMACSAAIEGGFQSSALGSPHTYESQQPHDRENLIGARLAGIDLNYTCIDGNRVKTERFHTAAQILQVFNDGVAHVQTHRGLFYQKLAKLETATNADEIEQVNW